MTARFVQSGVAVLLAALCCLGTAPAAELDNLPLIVRMMLEGVEVDWEALTVTAPEPVTLGPGQPEPLPGAAASPTVAPGLMPLPAPQSPGAVSLDRKPIDLGSSGTGTAAVSTTAPAAVPGPHLAGNAPVTLGAADLLPDVIAASALSAARRDALVALAGTGALSADEWKDKILHEKLTFDDLCAIWQQFRRDYPQQGESPEHTRRLWHGARDALGLAQVDIATLPTPQLFVLAEMQLYPGETEGAERCLRALLARLDAGEPPGPRVSRGLLAYRIAQCYKQRGETEKAIEWFRSCAEWGAPTKENSYDVRGEGLVEAARLLRQVGRTEEAEAAYRQAIDSTAGWGKAVATCDLFTVLIHAGRRESARALMEGLLRSSRSAAIDVMACYHVGYSHYLESRAEASREFCMRCANAYGALTDQGQRAPVAVFASMAEQIVAHLDSWQQQPLRCNVTRLFISRNAGKPSEFCVETWRPTPVDIVPSSQALVCRRLGQTEEALCIRTRIAVSFAPDAPSESHPAHITVCSSEFPGHTARVDIEAGVEGDVECVPRQAFFGLVGAHCEAQRVISVRSRSRTPFRISDVSVDTPSIDVAAVGQRDDAWRIALRLKAVGPQVVDTFVRLHTDLPGEEVIAVPVYAHVGCAR